jgi:hypothetical protein
LQPVEEEEICWWQVWEGVAVPLRQPQERNERWTAVWEEYSHGKTCNRDVLAV